MIERFLLHYFTMSAHAYTRGTFTTPESANVTDRDVPTIAYAAAAEVIAPTYLKWMLAFEEPESRTLWLAKATPRDWLAPGEAPLRAARLSTRYGRVAFTLAASAATDGAYTVRANVTLPASFASAAPAGGVRLRLRAPLAYAGKLSGVTIGGSAWGAFSASEETVEIAASQLTAGLIADGLPHIIATFGGPRMRLRAARVDHTRRVVPTAPPQPTASPRITASAATASGATVTPHATPPRTPSCPGQETIVDTFTINGTAWAACEDLQRPGGALVLVESVHLPSPSITFHHHLSLSITFRVPAVTFL